MQRLYAWGIHDYDRHLQAGLKYSRLSQVVEEMSVRMKLIELLSVFALWLST